MPVYHFVDLDLRVKAYFIKMEQEKIVAMILK